MSLIRVFEIPPPIGHFGGMPQAFINVDWFRDDDAGDVTREEWEALLRPFIAHKDYARRGRPLLVLGDKWSFTIDYEAP